MSMIETYIEDLESCDIEYTNEVLSLLLGVQSLVTLFDQELEASIEHSFSKSTHRIETLIL